MLIGLVGFWQRNLTLLFVALALMGLHSTLFGPVKYAILPQHLKIEELVGGNGLVEMGTFVAILIGTIVGGLLVAVEPNGPVLAGAAAVIVAVAGWLTSRAIPHTPAAAPDLKINWNPFTETWKNLKFAQGNRVVWLSMLGISWFWFYGATFLPSFPISPRTCWAATSTSLHSCWRASRSASASDRCCASVCPGARSSWGWFRSARSASRCSRWTCGSRPTPCMRPGWPASARSSRSRRTGA